MKKIINTIQGVLVSWSWKITDVLREMMNNIDFIIHWKRNKQEAEDFEKERLSFQRSREKFKLEIQDKDKEYDELLKIHAKDKSRIAALEIEDNFKTNRIIKLENVANRLNDRLQDVNNQYIDIFHNYTETSVKYDELQEKYNKLRGQLGGNKAENNKLKKKVEELSNQLTTARNKIIKLNKINKFIESKLPKKTLEEIVAYTFSQKEVLKRNKKNDRQD